MGFRNGAYCTVWSVEPGKGNFTNVRLTISRKIAEGNYEQEFSGRCMFIGTAKAKAEKLKERDRIRLTGVDVTNKWDKENSRELVNYKVFDFELENEPRGSVSAAHVSSSNPVEGNDEEESPF